jgi:hypothetical protein
MARPVPQSVTVTSGWLRHPTLPRNHGPPCGIARRVSWNGHVLSSATSYFWIPRDLVTEGSATHRHHSPERRGIHGVLLTVVLELCAEFAGDYYDGDDLR